MYMFLFSPFCARCTTSFNLDVMVSFNLDVMVSRCYGVGHRQYTYVTTQHLPQTRRRIHSACPLLFSASHRAAKREKYLQQSTAEEPNNAFPAPPSAKNTQVLSTGPPRAATPTKLIILCSSQCTRNLLADEGNNDSTFSELQNIGAKDNGRSSHAHRLNICLVWVKRHRKGATAAAVEIKAGISFRSCPRTRCTHVFRWQLI